MYLRRFYKKIAPLALLLNLFNGGCATTSGDRFEELSEKIQNPQVTREEFFKYALLFQAREHNLSAPGCKKLAEREAEHLTKSEMDTGKRTCILQNWHPPINGTVQEAEKSFGAATKACVAPDYQQQVEADLEQHRPEMLEYCDQCPPLSELSKYNCATARKNQ